jgi:hypothetical protein
VPRVYKTKGPEKLSRSVNVPMKSDDLDALKTIAAKLKVSHTVLARDYILDGIGAAGAHG